MQKTKKLLLAVLGSLFLLCTGFALLFMNSAVYAEGAGDVPSPTFSEHEHDGTWTEFTDGTTLMDGGKYYLTGNVSLTNNIIVSEGNVTLCLNGYLLVGTGSGAVITISGGTFTLCDCNGSGNTHAYAINNNGQYVFSVNESGKDGSVTGGVVTGGTNSGILVNSGALFFESGTVAGNNAANAGGIFVGGSGAFTLNGGVILGNVAAATGNDGQSGNGGGVAVNGGTFTLESGYISLNTASCKGGGVYITGGGTFTMNGGTISGNTLLDTSVGDANQGGGAVAVQTSGSVFELSGGAITGNTSQTQAGGVYLRSSSTFRMSGGEITGNTAARNGGGVYMRGDTTVELGGTVRILENTVAEAPNNFYLSTTAGTPVITVTSSLAGSEIGITSSFSGVLTSGYGNYNTAAEYYPIFQADTTGADSHLTLSIVDDVTELMFCNHSQMTAVNQSNYWPGIGRNTGACYLTENISVSEIVVWYDVTTTLCLNGYTINKQGAGIESSVIRMLRGSTLILFDCQGGGQITGGSGTDGGSASENNYGGGISCSDNTFIMHGGTITGNTTEVGGGGVNTSGDFVMTGGEISGNTATENGGGVYATGSVMLYGGTISGNTATNYGGGIYAAGDITIYDVTITGNDATLSGGGIYATSDIVIYDGTISENDSGSFGGGIYASGNVTIYDVTIDGNTATRQGGGLCIQGRTSSGSISLVIAGGSITNNIAQSYGGGIYVINSSSSSNVVAEMTDGLVSGNTAAQGGGIAVLEATFRMNGGTISNNTASNYGGGIAALTNGSKSVSIEINNGTISGNTASQGGGIGFEYSSQGSSGTAVLNGGTISGNTATENGGGIYTNATTAITIAGSTITGNRAVNGGGVSIDNTNGATLTMSNGVISENTATGNGGGIYYTGSVEATVTLSGGDITGNTAANFGGGIYVNIGTVIMENGTVSGNTARYGAGVSVDNASGASFTLNNGEITGNTASDYAGGMYFYGGGAGNLFTMAGGTISGNRAPSGAGIYFAGNTAGATIALNGGAITDNTATGNGGGVYYNGAATGVSLTISSTSITGNEAVDGAGVYVEKMIEGSVFTVSGSEISNNTASGNGGGVYVNNTSVSFTWDNNSISNNTAANGGGIYATGSHVTFILNGGEITGNTASTEGGGVYLVSASLTISDVAISDNSAEKGAGLFLSGVTAGFTSTEINNSGISIYSDMSDITLSSGVEVSGEFMVVTGSLTIGDDAVVDGRIEVNEMSAFEMTGGTVKGGISVSSSTFVMSGGYLGGGLQIAGNYLKSITGGYFAEDAGENGGTSIYGAYTLTDNKELVLLTGSEGDEGYDPDFPLAIYERAEMPTSASGYTFTYDGSALSVVEDFSELGLNDAQLSWAYAGTSSGSGLPADAGYYTTLTGTFTVPMINYSENILYYSIGDQYVIADVTINKKDITDAVVELGTPLTYTGKGQAQTVASVTIDGLEVSYDLFDNVVVDAGEYTLTIVGNGNFTGRVQKEFSIAKATAEVVWGEETYVWTGNTLTVPTAYYVAVNGDKIMLSPMCDGTFLEPGDYDFSVEGDLANYTLTNTQKTYNVAKADYDMSGVKWEYSGPFHVDGTEKGVQLTGLPEGVTPQYTDNSKTAAGNYTASVTFTYDTEHYNAPVYADTTLGWQIEDHTLSFVQGVAATCTANGVKDHYRCSVCRRDFEDAGGQHELTDLTELKISHDMHYHAAVAATETSEGNVAYYTCSYEPGVFYKDTDGTETYRTVTTPAIGQSGVDPETNNVIVLGVDQHHDADHTMVDGEAVTWRPFTATGGTLSAGYYYLTGDTQLTSRLSIEGNVTICLNGYVLRQMNDDRVIYVSGSSARFTLCDCKGDQHSYYRDASDNGVYVFDDGTDEWDTAYAAAAEKGVVTGGVITGGAYDWNGAGICVRNGATFVMYGGAIAGNKVTGNNNDGGGVAIENSTFIMYGGMIAGNRAAASGNAVGGGVYISSGTFTMHSGVIKDNFSYQLGGGVAAMQSPFIMNDGTITGNVSEAGAGVYASNTSTAFTMNGGEIVDNTIRGTSTDNSLTTASSGNVVINDGVLSGQINTYSASVTVGGGYYETASMINGTLGNSAAPVSEGYVVLLVEGGRLPYRVYLAGTEEITLALALNEGVIRADGSPIAVGEDFTLNLSGAEGTIIYYYAPADRSSDFVIGLPSEVGNWIVRAVLIVDDAVYQSDDLTVNILAPLPTAPGAPEITDELTYGEGLSDIDLPDGWEWVDGDTKPAVSDSGVTQYEVRIAVDTENYDWEAWQLANESETSYYEEGYYYTAVTVTVNKAAAVVPQTPVVSGELTYGEQLSELGLSGEWEWVNGTTVPAVSESGVTGYAVRFKVKDENFDWDTWNTTYGDETTYYADGYYYTTVTVRVNKADPQYETPSNLSTHIGYALNTVDLGENWAWENGSLLLSETGSYVAVYTPADTANYNTVRVELTVTVTQHTGGTATCTEQAVCSICSRPYGELAEHDLESGHHAAVPATCTQDGTVEYWECANCGAIFSDSEGNSPLESIVAPKLNHEMTKHDAKAATCTADGNVEYWTCAHEEGVYYADEQGNHVLQSVTIAATGHKLVHYDAVAGSCTGTGNIEYWHCTVCGKYFKDEACEQEISIEDTVVDPGTQHNLVYHAEIPATCTAEGVKEHWSCTDCEKNFADAQAESELDDLTLSKVSHTLSEVSAVAPTCTEDGILAHWHCSVCGGNFTDSTGNTPMESIVAPKLNHEMTKHDAVEATCTTAGNVEYWTCNHESNTIYYADEQGNNVFSDITVDALGHKLVHYSRVEATCTEDGNPEYWHCTVCRKNYNEESCETPCESIVLERTGHNLTDGHHAAVAPTCTQDGTVEYWECANCGELFLDNAGERPTDEEGIVDPKTGHSMTKHDAVDATCTTAGNVEYWTCAHEEDVYYADEQGNHVLQSVTIAATGHKLVHYDAVAGSCIGSGNIEYWYCTVCEKYFDDEAATAEDEISQEETVIEPGTQHNLVYHAEIPATCTAEGVKEHWSCTDCEKNFADAQAESELDDLTLSKVPHTLSEVSAVAPTCTEDGILAHWHCSVCGGNFTDNTGNTPMDSIVAPKLNHEMTKHDAVEATCTTAGNVEYWTCAHEESVYYADEQGTHVLQSVTIAATGHKLVHYDAVAGSCTGTGNIEYWHCTVCGKYFKDEACEQEISIEDTVVDPGTQHTLVYHEGIEPTCTTEGREAYWSCSECGKNFRDAQAGTEITDLGDIVIEKTTHQLAEVSAVAPTCTEDGILAHWHCSVCGGNFTDITGNTSMDSIVDPKTGHSMTKHDAVEATCTTAGSVEYWTCNHESNTIYYADEHGNNVLSDITVDALGHKLVHYSRVEATCTEDGNPEYWHCTVCGKNYNEESCETPCESIVLERTGHNLTDGHHAAVAPTCTQDGTVEYWECANCGAIFSDSEGNSPLESIVAPKLNHEMTKHDAKAATCTAGGNVEYWTCAHEEDVYYADEQGTHVLQSVTIAATGHKLVHYDAVAGSCTGTGNIEYWHCTVCGKYFKDEACEQEISIEDTAVDPGTQHNLVYHAEIPATCTAEGVKEHWSCTNCGKNFADAQAESELDDLTLERIPHTLSEVSAVAPTCMEDGILAHWHCSVCEGNFTDSTGNTPMDSIVDPKTGHDMEHHAAVEATCTTAGNVEYWTCNHESNTIYYADEHGNNVLSDITVAAKGHSLTHYAAVPGSCNGNGNIEYWYCSACGKYFRDADCAEEIGQEDTVVSGSQHTLVFHAEEPATCTENGTKAHWNCTVCGRNFSDENGETELTDLTIAAGHTLTHHEAEDASCTESGNVEYWSCSVCGNFFADADGQEPLETVTIAAHGHKLTYHAAKAATCDTEGNVEYWFCSECEKNFDADGTNELASVTTPATGHKLVHHEATETTGEYWECSECNKLFADADGTNVISEIPAAEEAHTAEIIGLSAGGVVVAGLGIGVIAAAKRKRRIL